MDKIVFRSEKLKNYFDILGFYQFTKADECYCVCFALFG